MKIIYKYNLGIEGQITEIKDWIIEILSIQTQDGWPVLWAIVDTEKEEEEPVQIYCCGTGWPLPDDYGHYLGTAADDNGYIWHYFANKENFLNGDYYDEIK